MFALYGANADAYMSREPEILLAGPAGTGKSITLLAKCLTLLGKYKKCRILFCRGTRTSLTQSGLVTWEDEILGADHAVLKKNPTTRRVRQSYTFANGSEFVVAGLDDPGKTLSAQYNFIYIQEATEEGVNLATYETLLRCLRNPGTPYRQIMMDCNPSSPQSWLYRRHVNGVLKLYSSSHQENPYFWDRKAQCWTEDGKQYRATLARMSGARKARFLYGEWVAAEGCVYDYRAAPEYGFTCHKCNQDTTWQGSQQPHAKCCICGADRESPAVQRHPGHLLPEEWTAPFDWPRVWGIDWGKTSPTVLGIWAVDPSGRMYLCREVYQTRMRPDQLAKWAMNEIQEGREPRPRAIVCDHDEERKETFEKATRDISPNGGLNLELADKKDRDKGIEECQARFDLAEDGRPRIFFRENSRETLRGKEPDRFLVDEGRPTSCLEELVGYTWDPDFLEDTPIEDNDHSVDQMRYVQRKVSRLFAHGTSGDGSDLLAANA